MDYGSTERRRHAAVPAMVLAAGLAALAVPATAASHRTRAGAADLTPAPPTAPAKAPERIVLFSGKKDEIARNWLRRDDGGPAQWRWEEGGAMVATGTDIYSKQQFTDFSLHLEFRVPYMPEAHGQERGNSGVGLQGRYEIQVLDSYGIAEPGSGDCGSVYGQYAPLVNACNPPLQWQTYDIVFRAPRVDADRKVVEPARVTVLQNGIVVQNNQKIDGPTGLQMDTEVGRPGPILLQFHGYPVAYRNIWVVPLPPHGALHY